MKDPSNMYDIFWLDQNYINEWIDLDILSPLESLMDADESIDAEDLNAQMLKVSSVNDKLYMMPRDYNQVVMYYNKAMFKPPRLTIPPMR